ncbi:DUF4232 domain-containing protein [Streptomyces sp. MB09-01]|uniref:DUF4232 domain-containing protein n=1 Tax=Streptomyces sp. MB09-01 TaxID=3028666 RepID=UPI0029B7B23B|nr:DUF4232 domain-containing protein [Streptomyces sp. MB09-01]MDX3532816.1 DUF4232 domain-containing protein [Streptomyces sp. MB09-01]
MIAKRWTGGVVRGVVVAGVLAGVAGCSTPPAPRAAPGPAFGPRAGSAQPGAEPDATPGTGARPNRNSPAPEAKPDEKCPEGGVRLVETGGDAAMGLRVEGFQLVNCGTEPYALEGYPEVSLRDGLNDPLEVTVEHGAAGITTGVPNIDAAPRRMTLAPGQAASWSVVWRNLVTDATVPATTVPVLEIAPRPGAPRLWLRLARPFDLGNTRKLGIGPWTAAAR